ncbi:MAG TPA: Ig-like domain-containing protein [Solirubrobacteraceae bacterium]
MTVSAVTAMAAAVVGAAPAWALDGALDSSFDGDGKVTGPEPSAAAGARQSTGKLLVAGGSAGTLQVARRTSTGGPDATWGGDSVVDVPVPGLDSVVALAVQSDDKVVAFARGPAGHALIVRLTSGGLIDGTYDGDGIRDTTLPGAALVQDGVLDSSGRAVVLAQGGEYPYHILLARHTTTGAPDNTYSGDSIVDDFYEPWASPYAVAAASGGRVVVSGYHAYGRGFAARYTDAGAPDPAYGSGGHTDFAQTGGNSDIAVDSSGRTLVSMLYGGAAVVQRLTAGGQPDPAFNGGSPATVPGTDGSPAALTVQPDGKPIVAGRDQNTGAFRVSRLTTAGAPDAAWGPNGAVSTFTSTTGVADLLVQPDKRVVAIGAASGFAIARYVGGQSADTTKPTATITAPTTTTGPVTFAFSEDVRGVTASTLALRVTGGSTNVPGTLACKDAGGAAVRCDGSVRKALLTPAKPLTPGQRYTATANPSGAATSIKDVAGNALATTAKAFRADLSIGDGDPAVAFEWASIAAANAAGGSYRRESTPGASFTFTYTGGSAAFYVTKGPDFGIAEVTVDANPPVDVDLYNPVPQYQQPVPLSLAQGTHTIRVRVSGRKRPEALGYAVGFDAFKNGTAAIQNDPPAKFLWPSLTLTAADGGRFVSSSQAGSRAGIAFRGTSISWRARTGPNQGQAKVLIDGVQKALVDNHAASAGFAARDVTGLSDAVHTIRVVPAGTKNASSTGVAVGVDSFLVG